MFYFLINTIFFIYRQLDTLQKALRASTSTAEKRFSLSAESAKKYQFEPETDKCKKKLIK